MTNKIMLKKLEDCFKEDDELNDECDLFSIVDYLATMGVPGAEDLYETMVSAK